MEKINDIIDSIKVKKDVITFIEELEKEYFEYLRLLESYGEDFLTLYLSAYRETELLNTLEMDNNTTLSAMFQRKLYRSDSIMKAVNWIKHDYTLSQKGLHSIHNEVMKTDKRTYLLKGRYRKDIATIGHFFKDENGDFIRDEEGKKIGNIIYTAPSPENIPEMMQDILDFYNDETNVEEQLRHPFLQSAITHALVIHVQPYMDGNGRTGRVLHHAKLWQHAYENYGINLSSPALYLSGNYMLSRNGYRGRIDEINESVLNNEVWNEWFTYNLIIMNEKIIQLSGDINHLKRIYDNSKTR